MTAGELAAYIWTHLNSRGVHCVLSGGSCVSIYTENRYQSFDLDFIQNLSSGKRKIVTALSELGFKEENWLFKHPDSLFFIEFSPGPLAVGSEPVSETVQIQFDTGTVELLSPTECVKDRLTAYYHWNDLQCLEQAVLVSQAHCIDLKEIERWSKNENAEHLFEKIKDKLTK